MRLHFHGEVCGPLAAGTAAGAQALRTTRVQRKARAPGTHRWRFCGRATAASPRARFILAPSPHASPMPCVAVFLGAHSSPSLSSPSLPNGRGVPCTVASLAFTIARACVTTADVHARWRPGCHDFRRVVAAGRQHPSSCCMLIARACVRAAPLPQRQASACGCAAALSLQRRAPHVTPTTRQQWAYAFCATHTMRACPDVSLAPVPAAHALNPTRNRMLSACFCRAFHDDVL